VEDQAFDVVVVDLWAWPDAFEFCDSLVEVGAQRPIIVTTAYPGSAEVRFYRNACAGFADGYFEKPFSIDALANRVSELLEHGEQS
jgi:DNA-binding response OmpR family regulator